MFIDSQAFSMSNDLAPPHPPLSPVTKLSPVFRRSSLLTGEQGVGGGGGARSYDGENGWSSLNHPILSASRFLPQRLVKF
jgi:hypothetical protein